MEIPPFDMAVGQQQEMHFLVAGVRYNIGDIAEYAKLSAPSQSLSASAYLCKKGQKSGSHMDLPTTRCDVLSSSPAALG